MARAIADAARQVGVGLTLLPTVYERAGFAQPTLREDQRRFRADAETVLAMRDALRSRPRRRRGAASTIQVGLALHSLRAATAGAIERLVEGSDGAPIHIHIAEQAQEIDDCLDATGLRPIEWLCRHARLDRRWQLVHATHTTPAEIDAIARCGAGVVLCPSTEANLGDGVTDLPGWLRHGVPIALGTDSHVTRSAMEELRLLEYGSAPDAPRALRQRRSPARRTLHRGAPLEPSTGRRRCCGRIRSLGIAAGRARRPAGDRHPGTGPARRTRFAPARCPDVQQPRAAVSRRPGGRPLGHARSSQRDGEAIGARFAEALQQLRFGAARQER
jgi:formiminoglutamate deiminase